jgi:hypothetical protein
MTDTAWGESREGREAEFEVSLTEARRHGGTEDTEEREKRRKGERLLGACLISCVNGFFQWV